MKKTEGGLFFLFLFLGCVESICYTMDLDSPSLALGDSGGVRRRWVDRCCICFYGNFV